ncbi:MAG: hypothetical protein P8N17_10030, partial [Luminiphilus sp.]|nr:hypothetical protein [Luminiphilus sp.]
MIFKILTCPRFPPTRLAGHFSLSASAAGLRLAVGSVVVAGALLMQSCATQEMTTAATSASIVREDGAGSASAGAQIQKQNALSEPPEEPSRGVVFAGTDQAVRMPPAREPIKLYGDAVSLNFEEAPLSEVVHSVLGDILELDYIVEHPVQGAVTLRTRSPIPREQLLPILESLLHNHGALMVRGPNNRLFISGAQNASRMAPSFQNAAGTGT